MSLRSSPSLLGDRRVQWGDRKRYPGIDLEVGLGRKVNSVWASAGDCSRRRKMTEDRGARGQGQLTWEKVKVEGGDRRRLACVSSRRSVSLLLSKVLLTNQSNHPEETRSTGCLPIRVWVRGFL